MVHVRPDMSPPYKQLELHERFPRALAEAVDETAGRIEQPASPCSCWASRSIALVCRTRCSGWPSRRASPWRPRCSARASSPRRIRSTWACTKARWAARKSPRYVESSDCVLMLGTFMTDINLGIFTAELDLGDCIYATSEQLRIRHHHYHDVQLDGFLRELGGPQTAAEANDCRPRRPTGTKSPSCSTPMRRSRSRDSMDRLDEQLDGTRS